MAELLPGVLLLVLSGVLLTLSFPAANLWFLTPVALVPFVVCIIRRPMTWRWLLVYYLFGSLWYTANLQWLYPVTGPGTAALAFYLGLYWALFAWAIHRLIVHLRWPAMVVVPLAWLTIEYLTATLLTGFPWFLLGYGVAGSTTLLQSADLLGVWTLSAFAAMTAGWIVDLLRLPLFRDGRLSRALLGLSLAYLVILAGFVAYGQFRLGQNTLTPGPTIAVVQENIPQSVKDFGQAIDKENIFQRHYQLSEAAAADAQKRGLKLDLIAWPETMVVEPMNPSWLAADPVFLNDYGRESLARARTFDQALRQLATREQSYLLVGAPGYDFTPDGHQTRQNIALLYAPRTGQTGQLYAKIHLVPFGEYVPFAESIPWLHRLLLTLTPYGSEGDYSNTPGKDWTRFEFLANGQAYHFGVPICYEDVPPYVARAFVDPRNGHKRIDFLINITNDGWYESVNELGQHLRISQVRAVENRVPMARSVNSGNSAIIDSLGRIQARVLNGGTSFFKPGYALARLQVDSRVSLYSRIGDLFPVLCGIVTALAVAWTILRPRRGVQEVPAAPASQESAGE